MGKYWLAQNTVPCSMQGKKEIEKWGEDHREDTALETGAEACCQGGLREERPEWPLRTNPIKWSKLRGGQSCWEAFLWLSLESQTDLAMKGLWYRFSPRENRDPEQVERWDDVQRVTVVTAVGLMGRRLWERVGQPSEAWRPVIWLGPDVGRGSGGPILGWWVGWERHWHNRYPSWSIV